MRKISFLAILVGGVVSYLVPAIFAMLIGIVVGIRIAATQPSQSAAMHQIITNPSYYYGILAIQIICAIIGGYLAGVTARHDEALNGMLSSLLVVLIAAIFHALDPHPLTIHVVKIVGIVAASALGGYLRSHQLRRQARHTGPAPLPLR